MSWMVRGGLFRGGVVGVGRCRLAKKRDMLGVLGALRVDSNKIKHNSGLRSVDNEPQTPRWRRRRRRRCLPCPRRARTQSPPPWRGPPCQTCTHTKRDPAPEDSERGNGLAPAYVGAFSHGAALGVDELAVNEEPCFHRQGAHGVRFSSHY